MTGKLYLDVEAFEEIVRTRLLIRCMVELLKQGVTKTTIQAYSAFGDEFEQTLGELVYVYREPIEPGSQVLKVESWVEASSELRANSLGVLGGGECRQKIRYFLEEEWCSPHKSHRLWLDTQAECACLIDHHGCHGWEPIPVSEFHLLQHYVRMHAKTAYAIREWLGNPHHDGRLFPAFERRLWAFIRKQNVLWERTVGLRPQTKFWRFD